MWQQAEFSQIHQLACVDLFWEKINDNHPSSVFFFSIFEIHLQITRCWFVLSLIKSTVFRIRLFGVFRKMSCKKMISDKKYELHY